VAASTAPPALAAKISRLDIIACFSSPTDKRTYTLARDYQAPLLRPDQHRDRFGRGGFAFQIVVG
jgi:hypothetical protein